MKKKEKKAMTKKEKKAMKKAMKKEKKAMKKAMKMGESKLTEGKGTGFFNTRVDPLERKPLRKRELTSEEWRIYDLLKAVLKRNGHLEGCTDRGAANFERNADRADPGACMEAPTG